MARRVLLHVGAPKTGTSFVQDILFSHREALREHGLLYPADRHDAHFLAALDLMELPWGGLEDDAVGRWDRLAAEVRAYDGTAVISHEILGNASRVHVDRALRSLGDAEVHVVFSARDLARQIPAEWQENVKHRRTVGFRHFLTDLQDPSRPTRNSQWFWAVQEVPDVLSRWAATLPPERVHLVTVPRPGAERGLLWQRYAPVFGLDPEAWQPVGERANVSLGVPEAAMVRRLNVHLDQVLPNHHYRELVRELTVHRFLAAGDSPRLVCPPDVHAWATELSHAWVEELRTRGYDVVGDLEELVPGDPAPYGPGRDADAPDEHAVADAAVRSLAMMTRETARLVDVERELRGAVDGLTAQLDRFYASPSFRAKRRLVDLAQTNAAARLGLAAYRRARGRNSASA